MATVGEQASVNPVLPRRAKQRISSMAQREERLAWLMLLPAIIVVVLVAIYPLYSTFAVSFTNARLGSSRVPVNVGFTNYSDILADSDFLAAVGNTLYFTVVSVGFELVLGLAIAMLVNSKFKGRGLMRAAMLVPWAIPTSVSSQMWKWMYNGVFGVVNDFFLRIGLIREPVPWLAQVGLAMNSIIAVDIWKTTPFMALLLLAGLQVISPDLYEAATVDGANRWQQFWSITMPLLRPAIVVALIFRSLDALRVFDIIFLMTGGGIGTETMATINRRVLIDFQKLGQGSAISVIIFLILLVFTILYVTTLKVETE